MRRRLGTVLVALLMAGATAASLAQPLAPLRRFAYEVVERVPQPRENFVQGLQIDGDRLYVSTGLYGESRLLLYGFPSMELLAEEMLPPELFGEGVTRHGDRLYQLTWRAGKIRVYAADSLAYERSAPIATQGWGITSDGEHLIYSDGSATLYFLDPETLEVKRRLAVTLRGRPLPRLNELEYIQGEIWANVWQANQLVRIDPATGAVTSIVDLTGLLAAEDRRDDTDVLNGIAWDADRKALWVTGKRWPWIYHLRLIRLPDAS
jgi:glutamine cyclotransferase